MPPTGTSEMPASASSETAPITAWIEETLGGQVTSLVKDGRWRPSWRAVVVRGEETLRLYIRGDRAQGFSYPLEREARILRLLEEFDIPVPHVFGMIEEPLAIVMTEVSGSGQLTGVADSATQRAILDDYLGHLVRIHNIPLAAVEAAGIPLPSTADDLQLGFHRARSERYRKLKARPEPLVEFVMGWLARNVPTHRHRAGLAVKDAGQFLVEDARVTAIYDLEIAHVMDPQADLAGMRVRNAFEPLGDLSYVFSRYAELAGDPIDIPTVNFHQMVGGLAGRQAITRIRTEHRADYVNYLAWEIAGGFSVLSALAEELNEELDPRLPDFDETSDLLAPSLRQALSTWGLPEAPYDRDLATDLLGHMELVLRRRPSLDDSYLTDVATVLGHRPNTVAEADAELERLVLSAGPAWDCEFLHLLHRQVKRQRLLLPEMNAATAVPGAVGPHVDRFYLEPVSSLVVRAASCGPA